MDNKKSCGTVLFEAACIYLPFCSPTKLYMNSLELFTAFLVLNVLKCLHIHTLAVLHGLSAINYVTVV